MPRLKKGNQVRIKVINGRMDIETPAGETVSIRKRTSEDLARFRKLITDYTEKQLEATQENLKNVAPTESSRVRRRVGPTA